VPIQTWSEVLSASQADSVAVANTVTATTILPSNANIILPSNFFLLPGQTFFLRAFGRASTVVTTPGTLTMNVRMGAVTVATFTTPTLTTTAQTNVAWWLEWFLQLRATGSAATFIHAASFQSSILNNNTVAPQGSLFPATAPVVGTAFDARASNQFDLQAAWSVANAANSITTHAFTLQSLN
jgi:hypothetical protein